MARGTALALAILLTVACAFDADFDTRLKTSGAAALPGNILRCKGGQLQRTCAARVARVSGSADWCAAAPVDEQLRCLEDVAQATRNAGFCSQLTPGRERENCIAQIVREAQNPELCKQLSGADRDQCLDVSADQLQLAAPCTDMEDPTTRSKCLDRSARRAEDPLLCQKIEREPLRTACEKELKKFDRNDFQTCWEKSSSAKGCTEFVTHPDARECPRTGRKCAAVTELDPGICSGLDVHRTQCTIAFATARHDPSLCAELSSQDERDECYLETSEVLQSSETCLKVSAGRRVRCAKALFTRALDPRLCAALGPPDRVRCERSLGGG